MFGIDFSEKGVRVGRMLNIIAGDGHTNVIELNSLDYRNWNADYVAQPEWQAKYGDGFRKLIARALPEQQLHRQTNIRNLPLICLWQILLLQETWIIRSR